MYLLIFAVSVTSSFVTNNSISEGSKEERHITLILHWLFLLLFFVFALLLVWAVFFFCLFLFLNVLAQLVTSVMHDIVHLPRSKGVIQTAGPKA